MPHIARRTILVAFAARRPAAARARRAAEIRGRSGLAETIIGIDSQGNVYTAEVQGKRVQKFRNLGGL